MPLRDLVTLKDHVCAVWKQYVSGQKSLLAAGIVTHVAFGLMRHTSTESEAVDTDLEGYWDLRLAGTPEERKNSHGTDDKDLEYMASKVLCCDAGYIVEVLMAEFARQTSEEESYKQISEQLRLIHPELLSADSFGHNLMKLVPTMMTFARTKFVRRSPDSSEMLFTFLDDEYSTGLTRYFFCDPDQLRNLPWLIGMTQTSLEIHELLNKKPSIVLDAIRIKIEECEKDIDACSGTFGNHLRQSQEYVRFKVISMPYVSRERRPSDTPEKHQPLLDAVCRVAQSVPTMPAFALFNLQCTALSIGLLAIDQSLFLLSMAHLYKAAQQYGLISKVWDDMEFIFTNFAASQSNTKATIPIVTKVNANADAYAMARYFRMALGLPPAQCQRRGAANLHNYSPYKILNRRLRPKSALLQAILTVQSSSKNIEREPDMVEVLLRAMMAEESKPRRTKYNAKHTPASVLEYFEKHTKLMEQVLSFDYINFMLSCGYLLHVFDVKFRPGSQRQQVASDPSHVFVDSLLWNIADAVHEAQPKDAAELKRVVEGCNFGRVVRALNFYITQNGSFYTKAGLAKCSGHTPKSMWPEVSSTTEGEGSTALS